MLSHQAFVEKGRCLRCQREIVVAEYVIDDEDDEKSYFFDAEEDEKICRFCDPKKGLMSP